MIRRGWERHLDEEQAEKYAMGVLPDEEEALCEEHLLVCDDCRQRVEAADTYIAAMKSATAGVPVKPQRVPWFNRLTFRLAWAFGIALVVLGGVFLSRHEPGRSPVLVQLSAMRGGLVGATAPAGSNLVLFADLTGLPRTTGFRLELVDSTGQQLWSGAYAANGAKAPRQREGTYFVRVRDAQGRLLREYGLVVTKTPAASAVPR